MIISLVAVGAGQYHHNELSTDIYTDPDTKIYVDSNAGARTELKTLNARIVGEVGDIINGHSAPPSGAKTITIFHSMGKYWFYITNLFHMEIVSRFFFNLSN